VNLEMQVGMSEAWEDDLTAGDSHAQLYGVHPELELDTGEEVALGSHVLGEEGLVLSAQVWRDLLVLLFLLTVLSLLLLVLLPVLVRVQGLVVTRRSIPCFLDRVL
jgi:hypothetical protein